MGKSGQSVVICHSQLLIGKSGKERQSHLWNKQAGKYAQHLFIRPSLYLILYRRL